MKFWVMNYPTFLKKVDALTSRSDADSLRLFVHEVARTIQEENDYGECAAFIAAFGEMLQSRGTANAKESAMQWYRREYSRRRAFHEELRGYGMKS